MTPDPDPHGQTALMLCEGLLLLLVETGVVHKERIAQLIEGIIEVKQEIAGVRESAIVSVLSISLLHEIAGSISIASEPSQLVKF